MKSNLLIRLTGQSVAMRTTVFVIAVMTLLLLIGGIIQITRAREVIKDEMFHHAEKSMNAAIMEIDNRVSNIETAVNTAASYSLMFAPDEDGYHTLLARLIMANDDIDAVTILYKADFFPSHGRYFAPTIFRTADGKALEEDEIGGPENNFCYLETDSNWIYTNKLEEGYWCLPYVDSMSTKRAMVTYSVPLRDETGGIYAVLCADIGLEWIWEMVNKAKPYEYSQVSVVSRNERFICHPDSNNVLSVNVLAFAKKKNDPGLLEVTRKMLRGERGADTVQRMQDRATNASNKEFKELPSIMFYAPVPRVQWAVGFSIPLKRIDLIPNHLQNFMIFVLLITILILAYVSYKVIHYQLRPVRELALATEQIAQGNFQTALPPILTNDEIGQLRNSFSDMQQSLSKYIEELKATTATQAAIDNELRIAHDIQMAMIPKTFPPFPERDDIQLYASLTPAKAVGGDLYNYFIRNEKFFFIIGDVSGKGVPASLVMTVTTQMFLSLAQTESSPQRIMQGINTALAENNERCMFVTIFIGVLDLPTGHLRFCNAGHDAPYLIGGSPEETRIIDVMTNIPVGLSEDYQFAGQEMNLEPGQGLFLYTDGLNEAENSVHEQLGDERVDELVRRISSMAPEQQISEAIATVRHHAGEAEQSDDLTMLALRYTRQEATDTMRHTLTLENRVEELAKLAPFINAVCQESQIDEQVKGQLDLALDEAVTNVVLYAYPQGTTGTVTVEAVVQPGVIKVIISDEGTPFDPTAKADPDLTLSAEERPIGGLGIFLIRQVMDSVNYERTDGKNILTLGKSLLNKSV